MDYNLILGSGGVKGFTLPGVLKAIEETQIPIKKIAGVSVGAIIGSLYSNGWTYKDIIDLFIDYDFIGKLIRPIELIIIDSIKNKKITPIMQSDRLVNELTNKYLVSPKDNFYVVVTNYTQRKTEIYNKFILEEVNKVLTEERKNPITFNQVLCATMSIPGIFKPVIINDLVYVDGGVMVGNCPVDLFRNNGATNIAVQISYSGQERKDVGLFSNMIGTLELTQYELWKTQIEKSTKEILITPDCGKLLATDFHIGREERTQLVKLGYDTAIKELKKIS